MALTDVPADVLQQAEDAKNAVLATWEQQQPQPTGSAASSGALGALAADSSKVSFPQKLARLAEDGIADTTDLIESPALRGLTKVVEELVAKVG